MQFIHGKTRSNSNVLPARGGGTGGGQGGHGPPKNLSGWAKVCFGPPKILTSGPPKNGQPVVKIFAKLLLSTLKCTKFLKFSACGGLIWVKLITEVISCF